MNTKRHVSWLLWGRSHQEAPLTHQTLKHFETETSPYQFVRYILDCRPLLLVPVELELMGWVRKVCFLMRKLLETVTEAARQGDTEFQTGTLGSSVLKNFFAAPTCAIQVANGHCSLFTVYSR